MPLFGPSEREKSLEAIAPEAVPIPEFVTPGRESELIWGAALEACSDFAQTNEFRRGRSQGVGMALILQYAPLDTVSVEVGGPRAGGQRPTDWTIECTFGVTAEGARRVLVETTDATTSGTSKSNQRLNNKIAYETIRRGLRAYLTHPPAEPVSATRLVAAALADDARRADALGGTAAPSGWLPLP